MLVSGDKKKILGISTIGAYNYPDQEPHLMALRHRAGASGGDFADPDTDLDDNGTTVHHCGARLRHVEPGAVPHRI